ncbi:ornithine carbamoyltransferase [Bacillus wiedmannii]|uniref:Ornithine carbamoyltransferase n=2 Tax=Bacillus cereus group TaxID=86661 RepID=A0AB73SG49_9BACI|nr:ornithine carbamoyltransferase [Bacillus wiedmannii]MCT6915663.1 ornithine carbamoyltransferase [Bacillus wiedmannii]OAK30207.1 ornithine carbamoyltransferase [Bacillus wiedmannii]OAK42295.1 ornithine carbamoyltransferase [Bacillus wiedmannii]PEK23957.1 ornithine carbamoyltransferase [Bacillus wiedmannii]PEP73059.1 ornithine carbamoyltransferase [Bacillus wiedmannii]
MSTVQVPKLNTKDLLTLEELTKEEIISLIEFAIYLKKNKQEPLLQGKILGLIFDKHSTRTRVSFEAGMVQLGGHGMFLSGKEMQMGRGETVSDTAKVLSHYIDGIMIRTFSHADVEELAKESSIPVINGLTDDHHPCQALADLMTIYEETNTFKGIKLAYIGDGNNVCHSLLLASAKVGMHMTVATPVGYEPNEEIVKKALAIAKETGAEIEILHNPELAVNEADFIYTDVWMSMGQEGEEEKYTLFQPYQINKELVKHAKQTYCFLHCLPAHREEEVTGEIIDGPQSIVFEQAGNRLHAQKALLVSLFKNVEEPS